MEDAGLFCQTFIMTHEAARRSRHGAKKRRRPQSRRTLCNPVPACSRPPDMMRYGPGLSGNGLKNDLTFFNFAPAAGIQ